MVSHGLHHINVRKRVLQKKLHSYPSSDKWIRSLDFLIVGIAFLGPITAIPQVYLIFTEKSVQGVSVWTWFFSGIFSLSWLVYGIVHKEKPLIISSVLWIVVSGLIVLGGWIYS